MIGDKLFKLRKNKNKTQLEMSKILGIAKTTYSSYEQNRRTPDNEMQIRIADYFEVSLDELLGRKSEGGDHFSEAEAIMFKDIEGFNELPEEKQEEIRRTINEQIEFLVHKQKRDS